MRTKHAGALALVGMAATLAAMKQTVAVAQEAENTPPFVSVSANSDTPRRAPVGLYSLAYDIDNDPLTYSWEQLSGPTVALSDADSPYASFTAPTMTGVIRLVLRVSDGRATSEAEVAINVRNYAPILSFPTLSPSAPRTNDPLVFDAQVQDFDNDPIQTSYEWRRNGAVVPSVTSNVFPIELTTRNDVISVRITADDGMAQTSAEASTTILDSPAVLTAVTPPPTSINYGGTYHFTLSATDPDGETPAGYEVTHGPAGFTVSNQGEVTWTVGGPLFDRVTEFSWGVRAIGDEASLLTGEVTVNDAARIYPMRRLGTVAPVQYSGMQIVDLDVDGGKEILVGASQAVYVLSRSGTGYQQRWVYPFDVGSIDPGTDKVTAVAAANVEGDARQEIFFSKGGELVRLNGISRREAARTSLRCRSIKLADLDGNGSIELICLATDSPYASNSRVAVLNAKTLQEIWSTETLPLGRTLAVGNIDSDAALEIVTAGGHVYDGATQQSQWNYGSDFGNQVDVGDLDGDGLNEIVGTSFATTSAFSAVTQTQLWNYPSPTFTGYNTLVIADANGDGRAEAVLGAGGWGNVIGLGYNTTTQQPQVLWQINAQDYGVNSLAVGDVDGDGSNEIAWGAGAEDSGPDDFVIAGFSPSIGVEWTSASKALLDGGFIGGELASLGAGALRLIFAAPVNDSGYSGARLVSFNPANGAIEMSNELGSNWGNGRAMHVVDYDNDNIDEVSLATAQTYDGYYLTYDFAAAVPEWQSAQFRGVGVALSHVDLNRDGYKDLVALSSAGYVDVYDLHARSSLWRSPQLAGRSITLEVADLDGDDRAEIIVAMQDRVIVYEENSSNTAYQERATAMTATSSVTDMVVSDLDGDAVPEIYVMNFPSTFEGSTLQTFDASLQPVRTVPLSVGASSLFVEDSTFVRKNLLIAIGDYATVPELWAIDPKTGADVWRAPRLCGQVQRDSLRYIDLNGDGTKEIVFATSQGMYRTR